MLLCCQRPGGGAQVPKAMGAVGQAACRAPGRLRQAGSASSAAALTAPHLALHILSPECPPLLLGTTVLSPLSFLQMLAA